MNAKYTMAFADFLRTDANREWFESAIALSTDERSEALRDMLRSVWGNYEIGGETIGEFELFMEMSLGEWKAYYEELLDAYDRSYDFETGLSDTREGSETKKGTNEYSSENSSETTETGSSQSIHVDLPNKQIDPDSIYSYPDEGDRGESSSGGTAKGTQSGTTETAEGKEYSETKTYGERYLKLRKQYLDQLRNVYRDFAMRFGDCFIHIF